MNKPAAALLVTAALWFTGCASGPSVSESADIEAVPQGMSRIIVYRTQVLGTALQPAVRVDGRETGRCEPEGAFLVDVQPGTHTISTKTETTASVDVTTSPGEVVYVECSFGMGVIVWEPKLQVVRNETGRREVADLSFTGRY